MEWTNWLRELFRTGRPRGKHRDGGRAGRLRMEPLEDRSLMAVYLWSGAVNGSWDNAQNWWSGATIAAAIGQVATTAPGQLDDLYFDTQYMAENAVGETH